MVRLHFLTAGKLGRVFMEQGSLLLLTLNCLSVVLETSCSIRSEAETAINNH